MLKIKQIEIKDWVPCALEICIAFFKNQGKQLKTFLEKYDKEFLDFYPNVNLNNQDIKFYIYFNNKEYIELFKKSLIENNQTMILMFSKESESVEKFCEYWLKDFDVTEAVL